MNSKTILVIVALAIIIYALTRPRERMCAASAKLTAESIKKACEEMNGEHDPVTNTCNCPA